MCLFSDLREITRLHNRIGDEGQSDLRSTRIENINWSAQRLRCGTNLRYAQSSNCGILTCWSCLASLRRRWIAEFRECYLNRELTRLFSTEFNLWGSYAVSELVVRARHWCEVKSMKNRNDAKSYKTMQKMKENKYEPTTRTRFHIWCARISMTNRNDAKSRETTHNTPRIATTATWSEANNANVS